MVDLTTAFYNKDKFYTFNMATAINESCFHLNNSVVLTKTVIINLCVLVFEIEIYVHKSRGSLVSRHLLGRTLENHEEPQSR
jgi:hypothetical protein